MLTDNSFWESINQPEQWKIQMNKTHNFKKNGVEHQCLAHLAREDLPISALAKRIGARTVALEMDRLRRLGYVVENPSYTNMIRITSEGLSVYHELGSLPTPLPRRSRSDRHSWVSNEPYTAPELRDTSLRSGAYDFRKHPSVSGNGTIRHWLGAGNRVIRAESEPRH